jgi:Zn-dependent protease
MISLLRTFDLKVALLFLAGAVLSIMLHELAHGYAAIKNGDLTPRLAGRMNLNPVNHFDPIGFGLFLLVGFGWAKPVPVNPYNFHSYRKGLFQVAIAGVLVNFLLAFFLYPLAALSRMIYESTYLNLFTYVYYFFYFTHLVNLSLCVFNLLPIYPLDGFRILESRLRNINPYIQFMYRYGPFVLIGLLVLVNFTSFDILELMRRFLSWPIYAFWGLFGLVA